MVAVAVVAFVVTRRLFWIGSDAHGVQALWRLLACLSRDIAFGNAICG